MHFTPRRTNLAAEEISIFPHSPIHGFNGEMIKHGSLKNPQGPIGSIVVKKCGSPDDTLWPGFLPGTP